MIKSKAEEGVRDRAHVPEHITGYVQAISDAEPFLLEDYLCYVKEEHLIFVGYRLSPSRGLGQPGDVLKRAVKRFKPRTAAAIGEKLPSGPWACVRCEEDAYYRIALSGLRLPQKVRNVVRRAGRELRVQRDQRLESGHRELIASFLAGHEVGEGMRAILERIPRYVSMVPTARIYSARDQEGELAAFDVAEFGARDYAFYMFNFRSPSVHMPGASDLLLHEIIKDAAAEGKRFVNLGLGVSQGIAFFKRKWGAAPFLPYCHAIYALRRPSLLDALCQPPL